MRDIATADERFLDRPHLGGSTTMDFLSDHMDRLLSCGMPNVVDEARYYATVKALGDFYGRASAQLPYDIMGATATYTVAREHTAELLAMLNPVLGTKHTLPAWSYM